MNILLTSAGRRTYLIDYFKQALEGFGKVHASNSIYTYSLSHADKYVLTPDIYDMDYIDFLLKYCKENQIDAIISLFDIDLPILAKNKKRFQENNIKVIVSDLEIIKICNDKWLTYKFLTKIGLNTPRTYINLKDVKNAITSGELKFPLIVKPRWGMGSIGIFKAENEEELDVFYKKLKREIFDSYLKYESEEDKEACVIIQEMIMGQEFGLDVLNDLKGEYVTTIAKKKIAMRAGETDIAEIVDPKAFIPIATSLSKALGHIANLDVDCFIGTDEKIYVLELNCRFGGQYPFSHLAGVDFPKQILNWIKDLPSNSKYITPKIGVKSCKDLSPVVIP